MEAVAEKNKDCQYWHEENQAVFKKIKSFSFSNKRQSRKAYVHTHSATQQYLYIVEKYLITEVYFEPSETSKMERFVKIAFFEIISI